MIDTCRAISEASKEFEISRQVNIADSYKFEISWPINIADTNKIISNVLWPRNLKFFGQ